jgi:hypothetical protein
VVVCDPERCLTSLDATVRAREFRAAFCGKKSLALAQLSDHVCARKEGRNIMHDNPTRQRVTVNEHGFWDDCAEAQRRAIEGNRLIAQEIATGIRGCGAASCAGCTSDSAGTCRRSKQVPRTNADAVPFPFIAKPKSDQRRGCFVGISPQQHVAGSLNFNVGFEDSKASIPPLRSLVLMSVLGKRGGTSCRTTVQPKPSR